MLFERLYEDNVAGKIDDARFAKMSKRYEQEQGEHLCKKRRSRHCSWVSEKDESKRMDIDDFSTSSCSGTDATTMIQSVWSQS